MLRTNESTRLVIKNGNFTSVLILTVYSLLASTFSVRHFHVHFLFFQNCQSMSNRKRFPLTFVEKSLKKIRWSRVYYSQQQLRQAESINAKLSQVIQFLLKKNLIINNYKIINIRKTFTPFLVALSLKGFFAFYLSFHFNLLFYCLLYTPVFVML